MTNSSPNKSFTRIALGSLLVGATGSLGFTLYAGRHNASIILILLFAIWVVAPFVGLMIIHKISTRWPSFPRTTFYSLMLVISFGALVSYSGVLSPPGMKPAGIFLITPLVSWGISVVVMGIYLLRKR